MTIDERIKKLTAIKERQTKQAELKKQIDTAKKQLAALRSKK